MEKTGESVIDLGLKKDGGDSYGGKLDIWKMKNKKWEIRKIRQRKFLSNEKWKIEGKRRGKKRFKQ